MLRGEFLKPDPTNHRLQVQADDGLVEDVETRLSMTLAERGAYCDLRDYASIHGSIPSEPALLARILGVHEDEFATVWPRVSKEFKESKQGRLTNDDATRVRNEARKFMKKQADNGRQGGRPKKNPTETQPEPMGLSTAKPRQSERLTHSKHKQTEKQTIVGRKQKEKENRQQAVGEDRASPQPAKSSNSKEESHTDRRLDNDFYRPTMNDAEALCSVMFAATGKTESVETARRWLDPARRARDYQEIEHYLKGRIAQCEPEMRPRTNAWFQTTIKNRFGLSPSDSTELKGDYSRRYRAAIATGDPKQRNLEAQQVLEEAARDGLDPRYLMNTI